MIVLVGIVLGVFLWVVASYNALIGIVVLCLGVFLWAVASYNALIHAHALVKEGWSGIEVQLKRRYDLIPNLVATVRGYATHEKGIFESIAQARAASVGAQDIAQKSMAEGQLSGFVKTLFAVAEQYPDLKANHNFISLQKDLMTIEEEIHLARRYYNGAVRNYNILIRQFPRTLIASLAHFSPEHYFEINDHQQREVPHVYFS